MSKWKELEKIYIIDELVHGHEPYWWHGYVSLTGLSENNHGVYRTMLRIAKNKKRKVKIYRLTHI